jgi:hypothetical protein
MSQFLASWTAWNWRGGAEISTGRSGPMTEAFVVYLLFVILTFTRGDQVVLGFADQDACLATRTQIQQQGAPGTETPEDAAAMIQRPLR